MSLVTPTLTDEQTEALERATLSAVAPPTVEQLYGWLLPFDHSTVGRAISAVPLRHHDLDAAVLPSIEARYTARGMACVFRVADVLGLASIQAELRRMGYQPQQPTLVQVGSVRRLGQLGTGQGVAVTSQPHPGWADVFLSAGFDAADGANRIKALSRSADAAYASVSEDGRAVACGTAAFGFGWASVHGMRTAQDCRGRGLASQVLAGLAKAAQARTLEQVFLQVEANNGAALALYQRAGFATAWRYHYWRRA